MLQPGSINYRLGELAVVCFLPPPQTKFQVSDRNPVGVINAGNGIGPVIVGTQINRWV